MTTALEQLMGGTFKIPHYQRGYRWEKQEVDELLDDLWSFCQDKNSGEFYCLQPIVLQQNNDGSFNVLDGQQRLTTLYILLVFLESKRKEDGFDQPLFSLDYQTRKSCKKFLSENGFVNGTDLSNIDFTHMCNAYTYIENWFSMPEHKGAKSKLIPILLDETKGNRNVRVIKYIVEPGTNPIDVFIRLNVGKIALTDAELTKALLLQKDKYLDKELEYNKMRLYNIAKEWDEIENTLQNDDFWYFLNDSVADKPTHIEFIFDLIANNLQEEKKYFSKKPDKYSTFLIFSKYLEELTEKEEMSRIDAVEKIWQQVIEYFEYFQEWFQNRTLYHYIGFLLSNLKSEKRYELIDSLISQSKKMSKAQFNKELEKMIAKEIKVNKPLDQLVYDDGNGKNDKPEINKILLLHNVYSTLKSDKERAKFPFRLYKENKKWSLEHIFAQNSDKISGRDGQNSWLDDHVKSISNLPNPDKELLKRMSEMRIAGKIEKDDFDNIVNDVYALLPPIANMHKISNLCLLDSATNSQLNCSVFDVKREKIKKRELEGFYIPVCTRNVFMKAYSDFPKDNAYWRDEDSTHYLRDITEVYNYFVDKLN